MGFAVPDDLSIVGWDDSLISQVVHPPLTAITRDIEAFGSAAARHLLAAIEGRAVGDLETVRGELTPRGSTAPCAAPRSRARRESGCRLTLNRISDGLRAVRSMTPTSELPGRSNPQGDLHRLEAGKASTASLVSGRRSRSPDKEENSE